MPPSPYDRFGLALISFNPQVVSPPSMEECEYKPFFPETNALAVLQERVLPVLDAVSFFEKTKFKEFVLAVHAHHSPHPIEPTGLYPYKGALQAVEVVLREEVVFSSPEQFVTLCCAVAGKALIAACEKYNLDAEPARAFAGRYPRPRIDSSPLRLGASVAPQVVPDGARSDELDPSELLFRYASVGAQSESLHHPLRQDTIDRIGPKTINLFFDADEPHHIDDIIRAADACRKAPYARVTMWGGTITPYGPQFIEHFHGMKRVYLQRCHPDVARYLPDSLVLLHSLWEVREARDIDYLARLPRLKWLGIMGKKIDFSRVPHLKQLQALSLEGPSAATLKSLPPFDRLVSLNLQSAALPSLEGIQCLSLALGAVRLKDIDSIASIHGLQYLSLHAMRTLTQLPDFSKLHHLRRIELNGLTKLSDLSRIASAPNLEHVLVYGMRHLDVQDFDSLKGHPSLNGIWTELGQRKDAAIMERLGITGTGCRSRFVFK